MFVFQNSYNKIFKGMVVYYDGQMNDFCLNVVIVCIVVLVGVVMMNYVEVVSFKKDFKLGKIIGVWIWNNLINKEFDVYVNVVVNVVGFFCDEVRGLVDGKVLYIIFLFSGVYIVFFDYYFFDNMGLIVFKIKDG